MTWNVENFFVPKPADQAAYDAKLAELADVITAAAPDLLAVQEVGDAASFEALRAKLGAGWTGVLSTHFATPHTIRVGWLSLPGGRFDTSDETERARYGVYALDRRAAESGGRSGLGHDLVGRRVGRAASRINQGRHELIDHILVSHAVVGHLTDATTVPLEVPSIGVQPHTAPRTDPPSDHRPVLAHFDV
ncbi:MAG TPA: endonuclease/exonuclease/phosphatase family protein [Jatrophihabitantaceae bacterium]|jgi:hypothetical protein